MKMIDEDNMTPAEVCKTLHTNLGFEAAEAYKLLRTNLLFTLSEDSKCHIVGVTSSVRAEGKSTTAINLAYSLAETGKKVLLIDGDMRLPSVAKKMEIENAPGLSNLFVSGGTGRLNVVNSGVLNNWYILPAGDIPPNPSELLGSKRMKAILKAFSDNFDFILLDLPPVNIVSDGLTLAPLLDGMIVVVREDYTDKRSLDACVKHLEMANVKILGFVMDHAKNEGGAYSSKHYSKYYKNKTKAE